MIVSAPVRATRLGLFLLSAATLVFEINLPRLFSVAQFYHFAFLVVSLALLGFGASGSALALLELGLPALRRRLHAPGAMPWLAVLAALSMLGAYLLTNWLPFDSFSIAWDRRQVAILTVHLLALATPFFFSGMAVGVLLSGYPHIAGPLYALNLAGSALGCLVALAAPVWVGGEGTVALSVSLAALAALLSTPREAERWRAAVACAGALLAFGLMEIGLRAAGRPTAPLLALRLSPYKGLSYALQYPGAEVIYRRWNAFSRVDVVRSPGIRSLPGLSYRFTQAPPPQDGLLVDGDDLSPIVRKDADTSFAGYMPSAAAFRLRPNAGVLVLEPRGGLDVLTALTLGARSVTAVEVNGLVVEAAGSVYTDPRVRVVVESDRSFLRRSQERFDVVVLSLAASYHPVRSGAYSLSEDYRYTVEAFEDALARLAPDGVLVVTRWLQTPPSEELRAFAIAVEALARAGKDPATHLVAFRGYNTGTLLAKNQAFTPEEIEAVRAFAAERAFDLVHAPGLRPEEANQHNILPEPVYYEAFAGLRAAPDRAAWYAAQAFEVAPPTDDRPFFGHFFKWSQAGQVLAELGKTWQPFGGAGYFVVLALLGLAAILAAGLILLPVAAASVLARLRASPQGGRASAPARPAPAALAYFGLIGLAFLLVEIPLIQRFILFLGQPAYALTAVLFTLLIFSGLGSRFARAPWLPLRLALPALVVLLLALPWLLPGLFAATLGWPLGLRLGVTVLALAPLGFLMGLPLPGGIRWLAGEASIRATPSPGEAPSLIPWAWGVNGAASVLSAILAALLALSFGFRWVLVAGAACYAGAWLTAMRWWREPARPPA